MEINIDRLVWNFHAVYSAILIIYEINFSLRWNFLTRLISSPFFLNTFPYAIFQTIWFLSFLFLSSLH